MHLSPADRIERDIQEDGHRVWGFVGYRCTYGNDNEWNEFLRRLRVVAEGDLEFCNGLDMIESMGLLLFDG